MSQGFEVSKADPCIYVRNEKEHTIFVGLYVDDIVTAGTCLKGVELFRAQLREKFKKDLWNGILVFDLIKMKMVFTWIKCSFLKEN